MIEPTIVFTHYALLLTASTFLLIGSLIGWAVTTYARTREINNLQSKLKEMQIRLTATNSIDDGKVAENHASPASNALSKKKDRLLKDFMKRQLQQKKSLDKMNASLQEERQSKLALEKSLNSANLSLDQWKDKCAVLSAANTRMRTNSAQAVNKEQKSSPTAPAVPTPAEAGNVKTNSPASIKLSPVVLPNIEKNASKAPAGKETKAQVTLSVSRAHSSAKDNPATTVVAKQARTHAAIEETQVAEAETKSVNSAKSEISAVNSKISAAESKLTRINGIGPAIEAALNELGIGSIQQMAELKKQDIKELDKQLGKYSGRIERQQWVQQAIKLGKASEQKTEAA